MNRTAEQEHQYVKFTGEVAQLKQLGFRHKAATGTGFRQWVDGQFRVFQKGSDVEFNRLESNLFAQLVHAIMARGGELPLESSKAFPGASWLRCYVHNHNRTLTLDGEAYWAWATSGSARNDDPQSNEPAWTAIDLDPEVLEPLMRLVREGVVDTALEADR